MKGTKYLIALMDFALGALNFWLYAQPPHGPIIDTISLTAGVFCTTVGVVMLFL